MVKYAGSKRMAGPISAGQVAKRLRKVETMARNNRPEMQTKTITVQGALGAGAVVNGLLTNIAQGNGIAERKGNEIRVWRVEIRGLVDDIIDNYLIQLHTTSEPTAAIFNTVNGAFILDSESGVRFSEWKHYRNFSTTGANDPIRIVQKFNGMRVHYNGTTATSGIRNQLCFTALNTGTVSKNINVCCRLWYTDA